MRDQGETTDTQAPLAVGTKVEVRAGFDDSWSTGFAVEEHTPNGYRLRRRSDHEVLPTLFAHHAVRREHNRSMWWY